MLKLEGIHKKFGAAAALAGASLHLRSGEVHALMGENGAGKSTLIKVITGVHRADEGKLELAGQPYQPRSVAEAQRAGISTVFQEINLVPALSLAENIFLGREPTRMGKIRWAEVREGAKAALARLGLHLPVDRPLEEYSIAIQQMTAIARAMDQRAKVLILDEATSSLDKEEVRALFALLRRLRSEGVAVLFVTHFLDQAYEISDRMTILRNGGFVGEYEPAQLSRLDLVAKMMGQEPEAVAEGEGAKKNRPATRMAPWLEAKGMGKTGVVSSGNFVVSRGETLGLAGLLGSGRTETARLLFGLDWADEGELRVDGRVTRLRSPAEAMGLGFAFCPEDRKAQGIFPGLTLRENLALAVQSKRGFFRPLSAAAQAELALTYLKRLRIKATGPEQVIETLSGGNQQKVILGRWLATRPRFFILDEPTRGIDVGAKAEIQNLLDELEAEGLSLLFISSELEEVVRVCERVLVFRDRTPVTELRGAEVTEKKILSVLAAPHG